MTRIIYRPGARNDLHNIWTYYAGFDERAADRVIDRIKASVSRLADFPYSGRDRSGLLPDLRSIGAARHVSFYLVVDGKAEIVRVVHGSRDFATILGPPES